MVLGTSINNFLWNKTNETLIDHLITITHTHTNRKNKKPIQHTMRKIIIDTNLIFS